MASQRAAYQNYSKCMKINSLHSIFESTNNDSSSSILRKIPFIKWFLKKDAPIVLFKRASEDPFRKCLHLKDKACKLCVCCKHCPCSVNVSFIIFVAASVGAGILLIILVVKPDVVYDKINDLLPSSLSSVPPPKSSSPSVASSKKKKKRGEPASPLRSLNKKERDIVQKAIQLWDKHDMLPTAALTKKLLQSTTTNCGVGSRSSLVSSILVIFGVNIALLESSLSTTLIHLYFSIFSWISGSNVIVLGKAVAMLLFTVFLCVIDDKNSSSSNNNKNWLKGPRVFSFFAFIGAIVLSAVDTGTHDGETSNFSDVGSRLWYTTVGFAGTFSVVLLEYVAPYHFACDFNWPIIISMASLAFNDQHQTLLVFSSLALVANGLWMEKDDEEQQETTKDKLEHDVVESNEGNTTERDSQYQQQHENLGTLFLLIAALLSEINQRNQHGALLAMMSMAIIIYGIKREKSSFQGSVGALGLCAATCISLSHVDFLRGVINMPIRLTIIFLYATIMLGGWEWKITSCAVLIPPKTLRGIHDALVGTTLLLLLLLCVIGNSINWYEWKFMMDFENTSLRLVNGDYPYHNRGIYILPWFLPLLIYYRVLYRYWPEQELKCRRYCILQSCVSVLVIFHLMRLVSWAELFLIMAFLIAAWPRLEECLRGGK